MTKEELSEYIKDNLSISIYETDYDTIKEVDIILYLEGEEVDRDTIQVPSTY